MEKTKNEFFVVIFEAFWTSLGKPKQEVVAQRSICGMIGWKCQNKNCQTSQRSLFRGGPKKLCLGGGLKPLTQA
jgi:hypothetical protein